MVYSYLVLILHCQDASEDYANYHKGRGAVPRLDHIIVFRDGVSEGEYERVATEEIGQIDGPSLTTY